MCNLRAFSGVIRDGIRAQMFKEEKRKKKSSKKVRAGSRYHARLQGRLSSHVCTSPCQGMPHLCKKLPEAIWHDAGRGIPFIYNTRAIFLVGFRAADCVRAVNGTTTGRRSVSVHVFPVGGACTLSALDNDYTIDSVIGPGSGRLYTSTQLGSSAPIQVEVRNLGTVPSASPSKWPSTNIESKMSVKN